jgi:hypothetical protein
MLAGLKARDIRDTRSPAGKSHVIDNSAMGKYGRCSLTISASGAMEDVGEIMASADTVRKVR